MIEDDWKFEAIEQAICEHTKANGIKIEHAAIPDLDNQIISDIFDDGITIWNCWDTSSIINFIFNSNIGVLFGHD